MGDIRLSEEQFQAALSAAAESGAKAAVAAFGAQPQNAAPKRESEDEAFAARMRRDLDERKLKKESRVPCLTDRGTRFVAVVSDGKVISLDAYEYPKFTQDGKALTVNARGELCIPAPEFIETGKGMSPNPAFRQLKWRECFQRDLIRYVGHDARELPRVTESHDRAAE